MGNSYRTQPEQTDPTARRPQLSGRFAFRLKEKADRKGRNPQTGETITITSRRVVTFKPSTALHQRFNGEEDAP